MEKQLRAEAAQKFGEAADAMVEAVRLLESCGLDDEPIEQMLQALEAVTHKVHQMVPPPERVQTEPADQVVPACRIGAKHAYDLH